MEGSATAAMDGTIREQVEDVVVRFAGDSGDGVQITGGQFTLTTALAGNDLSTFPDFPAEIRAPQGTTFGVSSFQIHFGSREIRTAGDAPDVLVALNPAALKVNISELAKGGLIIADIGSFSERNLKKAGYKDNPIEGDTIEGFRVITADITKNTLEAVQEFGLSQKEAVRCKNMYALGLVYWLYDRDRNPTKNWLKEKFGNRPEIANANIAAINAGHAYGETIEVSGETSSYQVMPAPIEPGLYRTITGIEAISYGLMTGAQKADLKMTFAGYPITPASAILHTLSKLKQFNIITFQAEDEIAAVGAALGASYAGALGVTASSGPGIALKSETIGLAISVELPLIIINVQRAGPSTGMPTKTEQSDLHQAVLGRNADSSLVVISASTPADNFDVAIEAIRIATKYMTPVMLLTDGYLANASEPWNIPNTDDIADFPVNFLKDTKNFSPTKRDPVTLARNWPIPGTPELEHRIGGIEKSYETGNISYDPANHQKMTDVRKNKVDGIKNDIPEQEIARGDNKGEIAIVGWGSTYGPITRAVQKVQADGYKVSHIHIRYIWPLPKNLETLLSNFKKVIVAEMNTGQLLTILRSQYLIDAQGLNKISGQPFKVSEVEDFIRNSLEN